ncbi:MAG: hypothetical protein IKJ19_02235 [Clostridia bacterium]|nr:hypothetical protein [Clostridia bacterium]
MKGKFTKFLVTAMTLIMAFTVTACTGGGNQGNGGGNDRIKIEFRANVPVDAKIPYIQAIKAYNDGQGKIDGVYVNAAYDVPSGNIGQQISSASAQTPNVVCVGDADFKAYASLGYFLNLDSYLTNDVKAAIQWDSIPELMINRYSYNLSVDPTLNKKTAGKGTSVLGLPNGGIPSVLYYNTEMLAEEGINVISIAESDLAGTGYQPHGYAEYKVAPTAGLTASTNNAGQTVYKVFNNKIPMNWEEFRYLMKHMQKETGCTYAYFSEYWFEYGWSVGGDCVGWDEAKGEYVFTLNDKTANFLAVANVTVNGTAYQAGEVLSYEDKQYLHANPTELNDNFYALPSTYEAFLEFNRLGVATNKTTDIDDEGNAIKGYGLAPDNTASVDAYFKAGTSPFVAYRYSSAPIYAQANVKGKFDIAPEQQYRLYKDGTLVEGNDFENIQVKVIGETYNGKVYTGELETVNGTAIVGRAATYSLNYSLSIAKNSDPSEYEASFKFASWLAGPEGQALIAKGNEIIPNQTTIAYSADFLNSSDRVVKNVWAAVYANEGADMGDWAYFDEGSWVTAWSSQLNTNVRKGEMTLTKFFQNKVAQADSALANMGLRVYRR